MHSKVNDIEQRPATTFIRTTTKKATKRKTLQKTTRPNVSFNVFFNYIIDIGGDEKL